MSESMSSLLQTAGEISVAFVGFASLIGVFVARREGEVPLRVRLTLRSLLDYGLLALLGCAVPLGLGETSVSEIAAWRLSSGLMAFLVVAYYLVSRSYYRDISKELVASRHPATIALILGDAIAVVLLALTASGVHFDSPAALYLLSAVYWNVFGAAMSFRFVIDLAWSDASE